MKIIYPILSFFLSAPAFACLIDYPFEYLTQKSEVIIVGEIVKMDYDLQQKPPHDEYHYSVAYVKVDEVLKADVELKEGEFFTFHVESKQDGGTSASIYWDMGMKGTWFFMRDDEYKDWPVTYLKPSELSEQVRKELSYSYERRFDRSFNPHFGSIEGTWPKEWKDQEEIPLTTLISWLQVLRYYGQCNVHISLSDNLDPNIMIKKIDFDQSVMGFLRDIADQYDYLDFEFGNHQIILFDRRKAEPAASGQRR